LKVNRLLAGTLALVLVAGLGGPVFAGVPPVIVPGDMIGSTAHQTPNIGSISLISQIDGSQVLIGTPASFAISGLAFDSDQRLWGTEQSPDGCNENIKSTLIEINPSTGALINSIPITDSGEDIALQDLAVQPGTDILFGSTHICDDFYTPVFSGHQLVTVDKNTGDATLVGTINTGDPNDRIPIAFAPDGTLYAHTQFGSFGLLTLDPSDASTLTSISHNTDATGLGVRSDGTIFAASKNLIYTIDPTDGSENILGNPGPDAITDLTFVPDVDVVGGELIPIETTSLLLAGAQTFSWMIPVVLSVLGIGLFVVSRKSK